MTATDDSDPKIGALLEEFTTIALRQGVALEDDDTQTYNRLFVRLMAIVDELEKRGEKIALTSLYGHPDVQVRMAAARNSVAVAEDAARAVLRSIADSRIHPQAGHAGMALWALDKGIGRPT